MNHRVAKVGKNLTPTLNPCNLELKLFIDREWAKATKNFGENNSRWCVGRGFLAPFGLDLPATQSQISSWHSRSFSNVPMACVSPPYSLVATPHNDVPDLYVLACTNDPVMCPQTSSDLATFTSSTHLRQFSHSSVGHFTNPIAPSLSYGDLLSTTSSVVLLMDNNLQGHLALLSDSFTFSSNDL
eukprot:Gb_00219 [translate_table: standard]